MIDSWVRHRTDDRSGDCDAPTLVHERAALQGLPMSNRIRSSALRREQMLASILDHAARAPGTSLMTARALHVAFAFHVALANGTLRQYLATTTATQLRYLAIVYQAIGAGGVANMLFEALAVLQCAATPAQRRQCFVALEARLFVTVDPLHDQIAYLFQSVH